MVTYDAADFSSILRFDYIVGVVMILLILSFLFWIIFAFFRRERRGGDLESYSSSETLDSSDSSDSSDSCSTSDTSGSSSSTTLGNSREDKVIIPISRRGSAPPYGNSNSNRSFKYKNKIWIEIYKYVLKTKQIRFSTLAATKKNSQKT